MLNLESRMQVLGVTVFQDFDRPTQFYYLPGSPHISRERGEPIFDLFSYRKGGQAESTLSGGFLNMAVDLSLGSLRERILNQLKEQYGDETTLAAVPFTKGTARVLALGEDSRAAAGAEGESTPAGDPLVARGPRFIQNILGANSPSLDGDNRAIFSFSLTEDGAAFFLGVLNGAVNARPVGVIYDLEYVGLLPAYDLEITINFKSAYEYMRSRFTLGTLFFRADVDNIVEELKRREAIKIKEVSRTLELSTPEAVRERQSRIDQLVKDLGTGALFQPSLTPGEPRVRGETITAADPTTTVGSSSLMSALRQGPSAAVVVGMDRAFGRAANPEAAPGGGSNTPSGGATPGSGTTTPSGGTSGTSGQPAQPSGGGAVDLWNSLGRPQAAFALRNIRQEEERTVTYNLTQVTAQKQTVAPQNFIQFLASPQELNKHVHVIDLNHPFFQRLNINVNARDVDFATEGITQMTVQLRYGKREGSSEPKDTAEVILRSADESKDFTFFLDKKLSRSYEYRLIVDYKPDFGMGLKATRLEGPWTPTELTSLRVHPSQLGLVLPVRLTLAPNAPDDLSEAQIKVRYVNAAKNVDDSTLVTLKPAQREGQVHIRLADTNDTFEVTTTLFYTDGKSETLPTSRLPDATAGASDDVVVVSVPSANRVNGDIIFQDPLGELQTVLVDTQLQQASQLLDNRSFELAPGNLRTVWSVRLTQPTPKPVLRYRERRLFKDGGLEQFEWQEAATPNLVVGIPAARVLNVNIRYLGPDISSLGLSAIVLDLNYQDPAGDARFDQSASKLITSDPASFVQEWKVRLASSEARSYTWKLTLLYADGSEKATEATPDSREQLILRVPQL